MLIKFPFVSKAYFIITSDFQEHGSFEWKKNDIPTYYVLGILFAFTNLSWLFWLGWLGTVDWKPRTCLALSRILKCIPALLEHNGLKKQNAS